jgi:hypothetical protein
MPTMQGIVGCGKPSTIFERVVGMLELSFCFLHVPEAFAERLCGVGWAFERRWWRSRGRLVGLSSND